MDLKELFGSAEGGMLTYEQFMELAKQNNGIVTAAMVAEHGISRGSLKYLADTGRRCEIHISVLALER